MLEADLEKSKGDKENAVAEERMKAREARSVGGIWMDLVLPLEIPRPHWSFSWGLSWEIMEGHGEFKCDTFE